VANPTGIDRPEGAQARARRYAYGIRDYSCVLGIIVSLYIRMVHGKYHAIGLIHSISTHSLRSTLHSTAHIADAVISTRSLHDIDKAHCSVCSPLCGTQRVVDYLVDSQGDDAGIVNLKIMAHVRLSWNVHIHPSFVSFAVCC
jgi:hypothetical protein